MASLPAEQPALLATQTAQTAEATSAATEKKLTPTPEKINNRLDGVDGKLHVQAGGGVVADSIPALEWKETHNKARAVFRAASMVLAGGE